MKDEDAPLLQEILGHRFANRDLLATALTHNSAVSGPVDAHATYQRLEFLGDRVLGLAIADLIIARFPDASEGDLSRFVHPLVSGETCAEIAAEIGVERFVRMGKGPRGKAAPVTPSVLGDVCEALIGAIYTDAGLEAARGFILRHWAKRVDAPSAGRRDSKSELQEWLHQRGLEPPDYVQVSRSGPDHKPLFEVEAKIGVLEPARGKGRSKREAEQEAAAEILRREGVWR